MSQQCALARKKANGLATLDKVLPAGQEAFPLLSIDEDTHRLLCPRLCRTRERGPMEGYQNNQGTGAPLL